MVSLSRWVVNAVRAIDDILEFAKVTECSGILLVIDLENGFDSWNHSFLFKVQCFVEVLVVVVVVFAQAPFNFSRSHKGFFQNVSQVPQSSITEGTGEAYVTIQDTERKLPLVRERIELGECSARARQRIVVRDTGLNLQNLTSTTSRHFGDTQDWQLKSFGYWPYRLPFTEIRLSEHP